MTEDAAVFGGQANLIEGIENARALYKPEMIAISTTCMAEVIGDDVKMFLGSAEEAGALPVGFPAALREHAELRRLPPQPATTRCSSRS